MRSTQPPESWADLAGAVDSHPSLRAAMKNLSGLSRTSKWTMRASRARSHRSSLSASIHEESIHIMLRHLKMSKDVTMQQKNLSSVLLTLVERHQSWTKSKRRWPEQLIFSVVVGCTNLEQWDLCLLYQWEQ
ncbi:uncharacterized protein LOC125550611 isoform X2 [Triticum urartu]|uniref:uncharacterized protein LOC125550611 isoform X2 n=1 Tax=Triticum urartu TaxID=4572 RepID=UPI0020430058|nr:uncharacterized protein LOC125550611 isoform X2 [Triticum urartu]